MVWSLSPSYGVAQSGDDNRGNRYLDAADGPRVVKQRTMTGRGGRGKEPATAIPGRVVAGVEVDKGGRRAETPASVPKPRGGSPY